MDYIKDKGITVAQEQPKYPEQESSVKTDKPKSHKRRWIIIIIVFVVVLFATAAIIGNALTHVGKVTSFSSSSISIKPVHGGVTKTYTITSSTKEQKSPGSGTVKFNPKNIHVGEVVTVATDGPGSKKAVVILLYSR